MNHRNFRHRLRVAANALKRYATGLDRSLQVKFLTFELTNECNSRCEMCHIWANKPNDKLLRTEDIRRIFADPGFAGLKQVILTGGELFLRDDVVDIVQAIWDVNRKVTITLSTNGILADKILNVAAILAASGIPIVYGISLDGLGAEHDKRRRVPGNFELVDRCLIPGLKRLAADYPGLVTIGIAHCLDQYGIQTFEDVRRYCDRHGLSFMTQLIEDFDYYLPERRRQRRNGGWDELNSVKSGVEGVNRLMRKRIYSMDARRYARAIATLPPSVHNYRLLRFLQGRPLKYECSSLRNFFLLRYDGTVAPCLRYADWEVGNLKSTSLGELARSEQREQAVSGILRCDGCLNTWCTSWSMTKNAVPFRREILKWMAARIMRSLSFATSDNASEEARPAVDQTPEPRVSGPRVSER